MKLCMRTTNNTTVHANGRTDDRADGRAMRPRDGLGTGDRTNDDRANGRDERLLIESGWL